MDYVTPRYLSAGLNNEWTLTLADYPAPEWNVVYNLRATGKDPIDLTSADAEEDHLFRFNAGASSWAEGTYDFVAYATNGTDKYKVESGQIIVQPDMATATSTYDERSQAKRTLDALERSIENGAGKEASSISINGKSIQRMSLTELIQARDRYAAIVANEEGKGRKTIRLRFT